jgi:hypothetical protein
MTIEEELYDLLGGYDLDAIAKIIDALRVEKPHDSLLFSLHTSLKDRRIRDYIWIDKSGLRLVKRMAIERGGLETERLIENCDALLKRFAK